MRNISFSMTKEAFRKKKKDVTRRLGWKYLKTGEHLMGVEKAQGLKKGEKIKQMGEIVIISNKTEPLNDIIKIPIRTGRPLRNRSLKTEMEREGVPELSAEEFVEMFCQANNCYPDTYIQRIEFDYI